MKQLGPRWLNVTLDLSALLILIALAAVNFIRLGE